MADATLVFEADISRVRKQLDGIAGQLSSLNRVVQPFKNALGAVGVGLSGAAVVRTLMGWSEEIDNVKKKSEDLGASFESLQRLRLQAFLSGFNDVIPLIERTQRYLSQLRGPGAAGITPFMTAFEAFNRLLERGSEAEKFLVLGRGAGGLSLSRLRGYQGITESTIRLDSAAAIERFNDSLTILTNNLKTSIANGLMPFIDVLTVISENINVRNVARALAGGTAIYGAGMIGRKALVRSVETYKNISDIIGIFLAYKEKDNERFKELVNKIGREIDITKDPRQQIPVLFKQAIEGLLSGASIRGGKVHFGGDLISTIASAMAINKTFKAFDKLIHNMPKSYKAGWEEFVSIHGDEVKLSQLTKMLPKEMRLDPFSGMDAVFYGLSMLPKRYSGKFGALFAFADRVPDLIKTKLKRFFDIIFGRASMFATFGTMATAIGTVAASGLALVHALRVNFEVLKEETYLFQAIGSIGKLIKSAYITARDTAYEIYRVLGSVSARVMRVVLNVAGSLNKPLEALGFIGYRIDYLISETIAGVLGLISKSLADKFRIAVGRGDFIKTVQYDPEAVIKNITDQFNQYIEDIDKSLGAISTEASKTQVATSRARSLHPADAIESLNVTLEQLNGIMEDLNARAQAVESNMLYHQGALNDLGFFSPGWRKDFERRMAGAFEEQLNSINSRRKTIANMLTETQERIIEITENYADSEEEYLRSVLGLPEYVVNKQRAMRTVLERSETLNNMFKYRLIDRDDYQRALQEVNRAIAIAGGYEDIYDAIIEASQSVYKVTNTLNTIGGVMRKFMEGVGNLEDYYAYQVTAISTIADEALFKGNFKGLIEKIQTFMGLLNMGFISAQQFGDIQERLVKNYTGELSFYDTVNSVQQLRDMFDNGLISIEQYGKLFDNLSQSVKRDLNIEDKNAELKQHIEKAYAALNAGLITYEEFLKVTTPTQEQRGRAPITGLVDVVRAIAESYNQVARDEELMFRREMLAFIRDVRNTGLPVR